MRRAAILRLVVFSLLAATAMVVVSETPAMAASGCRTAPYSATLTNVPVNHATPSDYEYEWYNYYPTYPGTLTATSQCNDIQIRSTNGWAFYACVNFIKDEDECNYISYIPGSGSWVNIATNVGDGTKFRIYLISYYVPISVYAVAEF
jgi:hypothetical protein